MLVVLPWKLVDLGSRNIHYVGQPIREPPPLAVRSGNLANVCKIVITIRCRQATTRREFRVMLAGLDAGDHSTD